MLVFGQLLVKYAQIYAGGLKSILISNWMRSKAKSKDTFP